MVEDPIITPFLRAKLHRPPVPADYVHRPRLFDYLDQRRERPLTLVSAPAGYAKSVLISCLLETCSSPGACLSLDEQDNDLRLFLSYFLAAVRTISLDALSETMTLVKAPTLPPLSVLAGSLADELDWMDQDFILALDDIHRIQEKSAHDLLSILLRNPPRPMHLVLMGRKDPRLYIESLRARDQVTEARLFDLRFATEETAAFLQRALGQPIEEAPAAALTEMAEGCVTGLRLAVLAMHGHDTAADLCWQEGDTTWIKASARP